MFEVFNGIKIIISSTIRFITTSYYIYIYTFIRYSYRLSGKTEVFELKKFYNVWSNRLEFVQLWS